MYKEKYIKYKSKYLKLKEKLKGGVKKINELSNINDLNKLMETNKSFILIVHVEWCHYCKELITKLKEYNNKLDYVYTIKGTDINLAKLKLNNISTMGFPALYKITGKNIKSFGNNGYVSNIINNYKSL